jgi:hypothetical protein
MEQLKRTSGDSAPSLTKMPPPPNVSQIRFENILRSLTAAVTTLQLVSDGVRTPFLQPIANTMRSLLSAVQVAFQHRSVNVADSSQTVQKNKDGCTNMLEQIHELLYAIIRLHINLETRGELTPKMLDNLGKFTQYVCSVSSYIRPDHLV